MIISTAWVSGVLFFIFNQWVRIEGEFSLLRHPLQQVFLRIHGAAAFLMMIMYGFTLGTHVLPKWKHKNLSNLGRTMTVLIGSLILSAYLLYYVGHEYIRQIIMFIHVGIGFILPVVLATHIIAIKKTYKKGHHQ